MKVEGQHPVGAGAGDQVGDELCRNRGARSGLPVLAGIAEIGDHRGDPAGGGTPERIDDDEQLHQVVVGRRAGRLDDEDVLAAHILHDLDEDFLVGKAADQALGERNFEIGGDTLGQGTIGISGNQLHGARVFLFSRVRGHAAKRALRRGLLATPAERCKPEAQAAFTHAARSSMACWAAALTVGGLMPPQGSLVAPPPRSCPDTRWMRTPRPSSMSKT